MSRRRGLSYTLMAPVRWLTEAFRLLVMVPYYETIRAFEQLGRWAVGGTGAKSFAGIVLYYVLWLPLTLWHVAVSLWRALLASVSSWPQHMRLRDLATGLPAFIIAVPIILGFSLLNLGRNELTGMYHKGMNEAIQSAHKAKDPVAQQAAMKDAMFYARSLVRIDPDERMFRFNLANLYISSGDNARGMTMMNELAPRDKQGFPPAHFHMARMLLDPHAEWNRETFVLAESHLKRALTGKETDKVDIDEVHRILGDLYRWNHNAAKTGKNYLNYSPAALLSYAKEHYAEYKGPDTRVAYTLAGILVAEGSVNDARRIMEKVIMDLEQRLEFNGDDLANRIELARAYTQILRFDDAVNTLQQGRNRSPDSRLDRALSSVMYTYSERSRVTTKSVPEFAYKLLEQAYQLDGENTAVIARYVQALCDDEAERNRAGKSLEGLASPARERGATKFLLAFDADLRSLPQRAEPLYRELAASNSPEVPGLIADVAQGAFEKRFPAITTEQATQLLSKALRLWPTHPDLLFARASQYSLSFQYPTAASLLQKAVDEKEKNVTLKLRVAYDARLFSDLAVFYNKIGRGDLAERYRLKAQSAAAKRDVAK